MDISSSTTGRRVTCYGANKPNNLVVTSKSYIEKTKTLKHNNQAMKTLEYLEKGVGNKIQHPQKTKIIKAK